jgi:hypothetical protein
VRALLDNNNQDSPDANLRTGGSDWAPGFTKLACPANQQVVGVAQSRTALSYRISGLLCEASTGPLSGACTSVAFDGQDTRRTDLGGDWDESGLKGQCAGDEYVAGISLSGGTPHSLLCCAAH